MELGTRVPTWRSAAPPSPLPPPSPTSYSFISPKVPCPEKCRPRTLHFQIDCKIFSERRCFHVLAWHCVYRVALLCNTLPGPCWGPFERKMFRRRWAQSTFLVYSKSWKGWTLKFSWWFSLELPDAFCKNTGHFVTVTDLGCIRKRIA